METLDQLAERTHAYVAAESTFQRKARILQSLWREAHNYKPGLHKEQALGSLLEETFAKTSHANFLDDDIRKVVKAVLADHDGHDERVIELKRLYTNLLSSQPMAFNLFAHLSTDLDLATRCLRELSENRIHKVTKIDFEFSRGRGKPEYTGDHSAFDVHIRSETSDGKLGFAAIEVKYHEDLKNAASPHRPRYCEVAKQMGCFSADAIEKLKQSPLQQIWRDHLLMGAHLHKDGLADGFFVFLSPQNNAACNAAVEDYRKCLTCQHSFRHWTLESFVETVRKHTKHAWIADFHDRYLDFAKVDRLLAESP